jgi:hypothetical protein
MKKTLENLVKISYFQFTKSMSKHINKKKLSNKVSTSNKSENKYQKFKGNSTAKI